MIRINLIKGTEAEVRKQALRSYKASYFQRNKERTRSSRNAWKRKWRKTHKAEAKVKRRTLYLKHKESEGINARRWQQKNPERTREIANAGYRRNREKRIASVKRYSKVHGKEVRARRRDKALAALRAWRAAKVQHEREYRREYHKKNAVARTTAYRLWAQNHKQRVIELRKRWYQNNKVLVKSYGQRRRARLAAALGRHTQAQWMSRVGYYGWRCLYCGKKLSETSLTKDHAIPLSRGGTDFASNLVPACGSCNSAKRAKTISEYRGAL